MLFTAKTITGYKLDGRDGEIGEVKEFYFDDKHWTVRYLVAATGGWLSGRQVLISPYALASVSKEDRNVAIHLTKEQIEGSPSLYSDKPVSRQFEEGYYSYYGWPIYWSGSYSWGTSSFISPNPPFRKREQLRESNIGGKAWDPDLRSTHDVMGHHIQASDGEIGHVEDFIMDDDTWAIRYIVVDTRNWWPGKRVLISPQWIDQVSWDESKVFVSLTLEAIKQAPEYTDDTLLTREYESALHRHYDRQGYWVDEPVGEELSR